MKYIFFIVMSISFFLFAENTNKVVVVEMSDSEWAVARRSVDYLGTYEFKDKGVVLAVTNAIPKMKPFMPMPRGEKPWPPKRKDDSHKFEPMPYDQQGI